MLRPQPFIRNAALPAPRKPVGHLKLEFTGDARDKHHPIHDISACAFAGDALFVAGDEAHAIERLTPGPDGAMSHHQRFMLADFLALDLPEKEVDIEGLAVDDGWLWITGSHSRTRPDLCKDGAKPDTIDIEKLADLKDTRSRCVLARIPLTQDEHGHALPVKKCGDRRAGLVPQKTKHGSLLSRHLHKNPLIGPAMHLAAKEGELDVEGIAVAGERVALGLRGPVIQSYAAMVEPQIESKKSGKLQLPAKPLVRLIDLAGLGIRDLLGNGDDLLILAGPTQDVDGRCAVFRWANWANEPPENEQEVRLHRPERLFDLPVRLGCDHPEGIELWTGESGKRHLLVLYDSPNSARLDKGQDGAGASILADMFTLD